MDPSKGSYSPLSLAVRDYENNRNDLTAEVLMKELDEYRDGSLILSTGDVEQKQFVFSIVKILSLVDSRSQLAWNVVNVLAGICNAPGNERILNHLQKLTPMVSNIMLATVKEDRKICALKVLETLTYGIRIAHPDTFVAPLIASLIDCSKPGNESSVIQLSLSVLANLLHRNKTVLFLLMQTVKIKDFMNDLLCVRSNVTCKLEVCKLMFLLEDLIHEKPNEGEVCNFIRVSFYTVMSSGSSKNTSHLQHCVSFFADLVNERKINVSTLDNSWFFDSVQKVINLLDTGLDKSDLGCAMLLFKFLRVFIKMEVPSFPRFYQDIMKQGIAWIIEHKRKASEVIITMQCILACQIKSQSNQGDGMTADELISVFLPLLRETSDHYFLTALLDFLSTVLEVDLYNIVLKEYLEMEIIEALLQSVPSNVNSYTNFNLSEPVVKMYIHLLQFVNKITTCCNNSWTYFLTCLFREQRIVTILAAALVHGSIELKGKVLSLVVSVGFPGESIELLSKSMVECGSGTTPNLSYSQDNSNELQLPASVASSYVDINKLIRNINNSIKCKELQNISSSQVLQLYDYKEQVNSVYQNSLVTSLTHATAERSLLQEQIFLANQINSELQQEVHCLRPALEDMHNKYNSTLKAMEEREQEMCNLKKRLTEETTNCQTQIQKLKESSEKQEKELIKATLQIQNLKGELVEKANSLKSLSEKDRALKEEHEKLTIKVENLSKELEEMDSELKNRSKQVVDLEQDKKAKEREIQELQRIRDTVFELTGGRKKF